MFLQDCCGLKLGLIGFVSTADEGGCIAIILCGKKAYVRLGFRELGLFVQQDTISFEFLALSFELAEIGFVLHTGANWLCFFGG